MDYTYSAFISYRHLPADIAAAKAVQRALETYRIPRDIQKKTGKKKLNRCFRDQDEMPLADDLGASIERALEESEWLIVICTPDLPQSAWCLREVEHFIASGRKDKIIPVLVSGEPSESFPSQIFYHETESGTEEVEPLAADLRGNLRKQLKTEKLRIVARMLNVSFNDLKKRERERALHKRLVAVSAVLAAAVAFAGYAVYKNRILTEERNTSARNATQLLIEKSLRSSEEKDFGSGLIYALDAYESSRLFGDEYDESISAALEAAMYPEPFSKFGSLKDNGILHRGANISNDGKVITCRQSDNSLIVYSAMSGERLYSIRNFGWFGKNTRDISPDSRYICRFTDDAVILYNIEDGTEALAGTVPEGWSVPRAELTVNNEVPVVRADDHAFGLYNPFTGKVTVLEDIALANEDKSIVEIHRTGRRLACSDGVKTWFVDTETGKVLLTLDASMGDGYSGGWGEYTEDNWYYRYWDGKEYVYLKWDTLEEACRSDKGGSLSPDGTLLATSNNMIEGFTLWDAHTGEELWKGGHNSGNTIYSLAFTDNDTLIACHEEFQIYRIHDKATVYDSGEDRTTYGYDYAAGRLVMPLRSGGCLVNLLPQKNDVLPIATVEKRDSYDEEKLAGMTTLHQLYGTYDGMLYAALSNGLVAQSDAPSSGAQSEGLHYEFEGREYTVNPVNGIVTPFVYVSPDGQWQAMIRNEEVDIFRAQDQPEPVMTIPGNGYQRLWAAFGGNYLALGSYVENLILFDLTTGECVCSIDTGAMCTNIQFSADARHVIAFSAVAEQVTVASTLTFTPIMRIPVENVMEVYSELKVGINSDGTEAVVLYPDGHADVGILYRNLDTLVEKARQYTE